MVIRLTEKNEVKGTTTKKKRFSVIAIKYFLLLAVITILAVQISTQVLKAKDYITEKYLETKTLVLMNVNHTINEELGTEIPSEKDQTESTTNIKQLITRVAEEQKIDPIILVAIVLKESSDGNKNYLYRFEPSVFSLRAKIDSKFTENERRMLASSHGITQIMGYRAESDCGVHWSKLYDNYTSLSCSAKIIKENIFRASKTISNPAQRLKEAYRMYNGAGPRAEQYASDAMSIIGELLFDKMVKS